MLEQYQECGIGSHLLERGLEWANAQGFEKIYNSIPSSNERAADFFDSRDFEVEAVRENHYKLDGEHIDEVMMAKRL